MTSPRVSVCVPTYNNAATVRRCVESVLAQTFGDFECLVVDDASTDDTLDVLRDLTDPRLRLIPNEGNLGLVGNHNRCLQMASGELVQFAHADDWLFPECLRTLSPLFDDLSVGLAFARRTIVSDDPVWRERYPQLERPLAPRAGTNSGLAAARKYLRAGGYGNWIGEPTAVMLRRSVVTHTGGFRAELAQMLDMDLWFRILLVSDFAWTPEELTARRQHLGSETVRNRNESRQWLDHAWFLAGVIRNSDAPSDLRRRAALLGSVAAVKAAGVAATSGKGRRGRVSALRRLVGFSLAPRTEGIAPPVAGVGDGPQ